MADLPSLPFEKDLMKLPLRAIVAYAARSARRVQPLYTASLGIPAKHKVVERAIWFAEQFCLGEVGMEVKAVVDSATANAAAAAIATENSTAAGVVTAAESAVRAVAIIVGGDYIPSTVAIAAARAGARALAAAADYNGESAAVAAATTDCARLFELNLGTYPELGQAIDPTEKGPLGPLWPGEPPNFTGRARARKRKSEAEPSSAVRPLGNQLEVFVDPGSASKETIQKLLEALSDLNREAGGLGLEFSIDGLFVVARERVQV